MMSRSITGSGISKSQRGVGRAEENGKRNGRFGEDIDNSI
jgi:hypothetical protein